MSVLRTTGIRPHQLEKPRFEYYQRRRVLPATGTATGTGMAAATSTIITPPRWRAVFRRLRWALLGAHELYDHAEDIIEHIRALWVLWRKTTRSAPA